MCVLDEPLKHLQVDLRLAHHAFFADLALSRFKLRLDQAGHAAVRRQQARDHRQNQLQRDKRHVDHTKRRCFLKHVRCDVADVGSFHAFDARILP